MGCRLHPIKRNIDLGNRKFLQLELKVRFKILFNQKLKACGVLRLNCKGKFIILISRLAPK